MKKYIYLIIMIPALFSCAKLEIDPTQSIAADKAITTQADLNQALTGCYDALQLSGLYGRHTILAAELSSDNANATGTILEYNDIALNNLLSNNSISEAIWSASYIAINRVNNVLHYMPAIQDVDEAFKNDVMGQLYFIRSLAYFNLIRYYGDVPLKTTPTLDDEALSIPRSSVSAVLAQLKSDLDFAMKNTTTATEGLASAVAAEALLARIALYEKNYQQAAQIAGNIIDNSGLSLLSEYSQLFEPGANPESIFEVKYNDQDKNRMAEYVFPSSLGGRYEVSPEGGLLGNFTAGDQRLDASFAGFDDKPYCIKYHEISTGADRVYVMRLAEMYLLRAEAMIHTQGDVAQINADINKIRERAGLQAVNLQDYDALFEEMMLQRQLEFTFEGQRWFDLIRNGVAIETLPDVSSANQLLFPIPFSEINTNPSIGPENQNPGY